MLKVSILRLYIGILMIIYFYKKQLFSSVIHGATPLIIKDDIKPNRQKISNLQKSKLKIV